MDDPWGLSGPTFLALYGAALVIAVGYALLLRRRIRRPAPPESVRPVDLAGLAFLKAGPRRVVEAAIARLIETGALRPSRGGQVTSVGHYAPHPIDAAVLQQTGQLPRPLDTVIRRAAMSPAVTAVGDALVAQRLLIAPSVARSVQRRTVLGLYLLLLVGVARLVNGIMRDFPVLYLAGLLVVTLAAIVVLRRLRLPARTVHGDRVVAAATGGPMDHDRGSPWLGPSLVLTGAAGVVALGGLVMFPDLLVREALMTHAMAQAQAQSWAYASTGGGSCGYTMWSGSESNDSGSGSSGGGSDGGGSSCGGGGGCGGGSS